MDTVELIMKIEDHFAIRIRDEEAEKIDTVADIYEVVWQHILQKPLFTEACKEAKRDEPVLPFTRAQMEWVVNTIIADHAGLELKDIAPHKSITMDLGLD